MAAVWGLPPKRRISSGQNTSTKSKVSMANKILNAIMLPSVRSAWWWWPWPNIKPTRDEMPVPVSSASAIIIYTIGTQTPDAVKANCPTSGIWAIQIRSTTLFSNINSCCNTTGTVIDTNSLRMGSVPNLWSVKIVNQLEPLFGRFRFWKQI